MSDIADRDKFCDDIRGAWEESQRIIPQMALDLRITSVGCVDPLTEFAHLNVPGGAIMLLMEYPRLLEQMIAEREEIIFYCHLFCGYTYVIHGIDDMQEQLALLSDFQREVARLAMKHPGCKITVVVEHRGSAQQFMHDMAAD